MLKIKAAVLSDAAGIARVHVDTWRATYQGLVSASYLDALSYDKREELWKKVLAPSATSFTFVVKNAENQIFGFVSGGAGRRPLDSSCGEIYALYVSPPHQGQAYGRILLAEAFAQLALRGFTRAALWVLEGNPAAKFYSKYGAVPGATQTEYVGSEALCERQFQWDDLPSTINHLKAKPLEP